MTAVALILCGFSMAVVGIATAIAWQRNAVLTAAAGEDLGAAGQAGNSAAMAELIAERDAAKAASRAKSAFLANMSHELRTPMNAVLGYSEMLLEEAENTEGCEALADDLGKIHSAGRHLLGLITNILDLSKIEAGKMEVTREQIDLQRIFREVEATARPLVERNRNTLTFERAAGCETISSDQQLLRQALLNLVSNAAKFTEDGTITVAAGYNASGALEIAVRDTGIGMNDAQVARLFRPYEQAGNDVHRKYGGTGLGLAITRGICDVLGGDIRAESRVHEGTTFTITLPTGVSALPAGPATGLFGQDYDMADKDQDADRETGLKVLIIDDDAAAVDLMEKTLSREGFATSSALDGQSGLELARGEKPDAIVLDIAMPGLDGWNVLHEIKKDEDLKSIPVVMVSSMDQPTRKEDDDPEAYFMKPFNRSALADTIRRLVNTRPEAIGSDDVLVEEKEARNVA